MFSKAREPTARPDDARPTRTLRCISRRKRDNWRKNWRHAQDASPALARQADKGRVTGDDHLAEGISAAPRANAGSAQRRAGVRQSCRAL